MHLRDFPHTYTKAGEAPRQVYYTVEARELREDGWVRDEKAAPEPDPVEDEVQAPGGEDEDEDEDTSEPIVGDIDFEAMTKRQLLEYAKDRGVDLPDNALKAELIESCKAF